MNEERKIIIAPDSGIAIRSLESIPCLWSLLQHQIDS